ncbi:MAG: DNA cytosine methyltransferase, partial [Trebonia sp.]
SPPCTTFSESGDQAGNECAVLLAELIGAALVGQDTRSAHRAAMSTYLTGSTWKADAQDRDARIRSAVLSAALVDEPARFIAACRPEWVVLEQVPSVLPLWDVYACALATAGYSAWAGVLDAADYGVPQRRVRAVLIASTAHRVERPAPTHYNPRPGTQLWGQPWTTMAAALGWGAAGRPAPTVTAGGTAAGGAEPFGHWSRDSLHAARRAGHWITRGEAGTPRPRARPTTVPGETRIGGPGHNGREHGGESHCGRDEVRITVAEAGVLQSFPQDYPWKGTKTQQYQQAGNAVPPLLAEHVLAMATGIARQEAAA